MHVSSTDTINQDNQYRRHRLASYSPYFTRCPSACASRIVMRVWHWSSCEDQNPVVRNAKSLKCGIRKRQKHRERIQMGRLTDKLFTRGKTALCLAKCSSKTPGIHYPMPLHSQWKHQALWKIHHATAGLCPGSSPPVVRAASGGAGSILLSMFSMFIGLDAYIMFICFLNAWAPWSKIRCFGASVGFLCLQR